MYQIQLSDQIYDEVKQRADRAGFTSVDDYIVDILTQGEPAEKTENLDHFFTPERIAHIDAVIERVKAGGKTYSMEEVRENLAKNRKEWLRANNS